MVRPPTSIVILDFSFLVKVKPAMSSIQCSVFVSSPRRFRSSSSNFFSSASMSMSGSDILLRPPTFPIVAMFWISQLSGCLDGNDALGRLLAESDDALGKLGRGLGCFIRLEARAELYELRFDRGVVLVARSELCSAKR